MKMQDNRMSMDGGNQGFEELTRITKIMRPLINTAARQIFLSFMSELLTRPIDYIVPAIWGLKKGGGLDDTQLAIHGQIMPVIKIAVDQFQGTSMDRNQEFYVKYLVSELLIAKIIIWIQMGKNQAGEQEDHRREKDLLLEDLEAAGYA